MPLYEYECKKCGKAFEELVKNSSEKVSCPECGGKRVQRLMSKVAFKTDGKMTTTSSSGNGCASCSSGSCSSCG